MRLHAVFCFFIGIVYKAAMYNTYTHYIYTLSQCSVLLTYFAILYYKSVIKQTTLKPLTEQRQFWLQAKYLFSALFNDLWSRMLPMFDSEISFCFKAC